LLPNQVRLASRDAPAYFTACHVLSSGFLLACQKASGMPITAGRKYAGTFGILLKSGLQQVGGVKLLCYGVESKLIHLEQGFGLNLPLAGELKFQKEIIEINRLGNIDCFPRSPYLFPQLISGIPSYDQLGLTRIDAFKLSENINSIYFTSKFRVGNDGIEGLAPE